MAVYRIYPEKTAFISSQKVTANAGRDEILELAGYPYQGVGRSNRVLIQFNSEDITSGLDVVLAGESVFTSSLMMYLASGEGVPDLFKVYASPLSGSWQQGRGKFYDEKINTSGVSWKTTNADGIEWATSSFAPGVTASFLDGQKGGGTWYTEVAGQPSVYTESIYRSSGADLNINVSDGISLFRDEVIENNGFLLKLGDDLEFQTSASENTFIKYFSNDTHTIYPPVLDVRWDDQIYATSSEQVPLTDKRGVVVLKNSGEYIDEGEQKFRFLCRPLYPKRQFVTSSVYLDDKFVMNPTTQWGIQDLDTGDMVIDFDPENTKVSADTESPYFRVYMDSFQPNRYYKLLIKSKIDSSDIVFDNDNVFKVIANG